MASKRRDDVAKKKLVRQRLRLLIRSVIVNRNWLSDTGEQKISLNVKKNIAMMVRQQRKVGLLTIAEKSMIRKPHSLRTVSERKKLLTLIAGLNCFSKIPPTLRARLVPYINFMVLNSGRTVIKEGHRPTTIYFLLTGELEITRKVFNHATKSYENKIESIACPGDAVGDIELLENIPRMTSMVTISECELLVLNLEEFDQILRPYMSRQWFDKKSAIQTLPYFKYLSEDQVITACKLSVVRQFNPLETIYYEDKGKLGYVHFVLSGACMILQSLQIKATQKGELKSFELVDISKDDGGSFFQNLTKKEIIKKIREEDTRKIAIELNDIESDEVKDDTNMRASSKSSIYVTPKMSTKAMEIACGLRSKSNESLGTTENFHLNEEYLDEEEGAEQEGEEEEETIVEKFLEDTEKHSDIYENSENKSIRTSLSTNTLKSESSKLKSVSLKSVLKSPKTQKRKKSLNELTTKIENHFIDVGSLTYGAIFGIGEKLEHRVILARNVVQCLCLPLYWLLEHEQNPGGVWERRCFHLNTTIPSREILFNDFMLTRQWQHFKDNLLENTICYSPGNPTKVQDIPFYIPV